MPVLIATPDPSLAQPPPLPTGCLMRPCAPGDEEELAYLYFRAYPPGEASATLEEARADIAVSLAGAYGEFWPSASPVVLCDDALVAAVLTVRRASWEDAPACPYIIEVFTAPEQRRRGLARAVVQAAMAKLHESGEQQVALTVEAENSPALALYASLGFREATGT